jgi:hypothetical protein
MFLRDGGADFAGQDACSCLPSSGRVDAKIRLGGEHHLSRNLIATVSFNKAQRPHRLEREGVSF